MDGVDWIFWGGGDVEIEEGFFPQKTRKGAAVLAARTPLGRTRVFVAIWNCWLADLKFGHYTCSEGGPYNGERTPSLTMSALSNIS